MKALSRNRLAPHQRDLIVREADKQYEKIKHQHEEVFSNRLLFLVMLAISIVLDEEFGFGSARRKRFIDAFVSKINELSGFLCENKCVYQNGHKDFDVEYNRECLRKLADQYGIAYKESMFDDLFENL